MTNLRPFSGVKGKCPKCSHAGNVSTRYFEDTETEYLVRKCNGSCGYTWKERVADSDRPAAPSTPRGTKPPAKSDLMELLGLVDVEKAFEKLLGRIIKED